MDPQRGWGGGRGERGEKGNEGGRGGGGEGGDGLSQSPTTAAVAPVFVPVIDGFT